MTDIAHSAVAPADGIHVVQNYIYANEAARLAASGFASTDVGRVSLQSDTGALWALQKATPARWRRTAGPMPVHQDATTAFVLALVDEDAVKQTTAATAVSVTVPLNATVPFDIGDTILLQQSGAGVITLVPASGAVFLRSKGSLLSSSGQYAVLSLTYLGADTWMVTGDRA